MLGYAERPTGKGKSANPYCVNHSGMVSTATPFDADWLFTLPRDKLIAWEEMETTVKTRNKVPRAAYGLAAAVLAMSGSALFNARSASAANPPGSPQQPQGQVPAPKIVVKQDDLAAQSLVFGVPDESAPRNQLFPPNILVATCKNLGAQTYKPGYRALRLYHTVGNKNYVVAASFIPQLGAGKTFSISYQLPVEAESGYDVDFYWIEVSPGSHRDEAPSNDCYIPDPDEMDGGSSRLKAGI